MTVDEWFKMTVDERFKMTVDERFKMTVDERFEKSLNVLYFVEILFQECKQRKLVKRGIWVTDILQDGG